MLDFITQAGTSLLATPSKYSPSKAAETTGGARMPPADPLSPYTPEAEQNIKVSKVGVVVYIYICYTFTIYRDVLIAVFRHQYGVVSLIFIVAVLYLLVFLTL